MKIVNSILLIITLALVTSCSNNMKPEDFKNTKPSLLIEEYFDGKVKAWGILQDRSGKVTRQFKADLVGSFKDNVITLDEDFYWTDGEKQKRTWKIKKIDDNNYVGTAPDVVGEATGVQYGSAFKFETKSDILSRNFQYPACTSFVSSRNLYTPDIGNSLTKYPISFRI